jgi:RNA polymerase sigma-70 factor (ECF subfamily)
MAKTADLASLLAHADWLRDLARKLVGGAAADDAVQDTYVAALRSPPDPELPAKPWLARVLRNASRMSHRSATRRARREDAVSTIASPATSAADTVARAETFRLLIELVLALAEPYRATLLRHYFDGESFAAIARRDAIPEATVRGRHKQALEQLRRRLDARSHGDRRAWLASLAPLAAPPAHTASIIVGVIIVKKLVIAAVIAVVAAGLVWHWYPRTPDRTTTAVAGSGTLSATGPGASSSAASPALPPPPQHVRKLGSPEERRALAGRIATAQANRKAERTAHHSSMGPSDSTGGQNAGSGHEGDMDRDTLRGAMHEVLPFLTDCYAAARPKMATDHILVRAHFTLTGDPDIGTVIDAKQLADENSHAVPADFDDCVRSTIQTLELPPLADGDTIEVDYPLMFSDGPPPDGSGSGTP